MISAYHQYFLQNGEVKTSVNYNSEILNSGLSIYEVMRVINAKILFFEEHYTRLLNSAKMLSFDLWIFKEEIQSQMQKLIEANKIDDGNIEIIYNISDSGKKTFLCLFIEDRYPTPKMLQNGIASELHYAERENPNAKIINLNLREKTNHQIKKEELYEVLLVDKNGFVTEGSRSNVFFIQNNEVFTTPVSEVLPGVTRLKVFEICNNNNIPIKEIPIKAGEIDQYKAAFYTGTSPGVLPIANIGEVNYNTENELMQYIVRQFSSYIL